jgi:F-type H+-transporting ATPase subunit O
LYGLEGRYAHAIYSAAIQSNSLDAVNKDFQGILDLFTTEKKLNDILKNPLLTKQQKNSKQVISNHFLFYFIKSIFNYLN